MEPVDAGQLQETEPAPSGLLDADHPLLLGGAVLMVLILGIVIAAFLRSSSPPSELPAAPPPLALPPPASVDEASLGVEGPPALPREAVGPGPGVLEQLRVALSRSRSALQLGLQRFLGQPDDQAGLDALEEALIGADVGVATAHLLIEAVKTEARKEHQTGEALLGVLRREMVGILERVDAPLDVRGPSPFVILVVGVNGSGKTTTIGKLSHRFADEGKRVMLAAADTYRAAAAEQLEVWAERTGADFTRLDERADPGAVVYQALEKAAAGGHDVVIVDTAGRLQTRKPLMEQLSKIRRVIQKRIPDAPQETLLVLDGTMGQNGMSQARLFHAATPLTGVVVTKLDGTAKGGMVLAIAAELELPVKLVGLGERAEDLRDFEPKAFVEALV